MNPFDKQKKPDAPPAPGEGPKKAPTESKEAPSPKPFGGGDAKPTKGGGKSAPETPGQGVPDVKPHPEPGVKKEPEGSNAPLPKEANEAKKMAQEPPKGLPSVATMTKAEAEKGTGKTAAGGDPAMAQMMTIVETMARLIQKLGPATPAPGGAPTQQMLNGGKPGMPGRPAPGTVTGVGPGGAGVAAPPPKQMTMEQIAGVMGIIDAANAGRLSRPGAAMLISHGFGVDFESATQMVSQSAPAAPALGPDGEPALGPDGEPLEPGEEGEPALGPDGEPLEPGEEGEPALGPDGEPVAKPPGEDGLDEEGKSEFARSHGPFTPDGGTEEDEDGLDVRGQSKFARSHGPFKSDSAEVVQEAIERLERLKGDLTTRLNSLVYAKEAVERFDEFDESQHPRDESGKFTSGGGGGGGGGKKERDMKSVPHVTVDKNWVDMWKSDKPQPGNGRNRVPDKVYHNAARQAEAEGNRAKAERLFKLADAVRGERQAVKARMREEMKQAAANFKQYGKEHPDTPKQGKDEYFKTNAHPANIEKLRTPQVKSLKPLGGGTNVTQKVTLADGSKAVWKPQHGEDEGLRSNVPKGTYYIREAAAANVARALGVQDLVPAVVAFHGDNAGYRNTLGVQGEHGPFGRPKSIEEHAQGKGEDYTVTEAREQGAVGSLHAWAPGKMVAEFWDPPEMEREAIERARVFDYVTGNSDRHGKNMLINERDGKNYPVLIDNGLAFNTKGAPDRIIYPTGTLRHAGLLPSTREMIKKIDPHEVAKVLKASGLDRDAAKLTLQRLHHIQADPDFLDSHGSESRAKFAYGWYDYDKKTHASQVLHQYEDLAEATLSAHDGTRK